MRKVAIIFKRGDLWEMMDYRKLREYLPEPTALDQLGITDIANKFKLLKKGMRFLEDKGLSPKEGYAIKKFYYDSSEMYNGNYTNYLDDFVDKIVRSKPDYFIIDPSPVGFENGELTKFLEKLHSLDSITNVCIFYSSYGYDEKKLVEQFEENNLDYIGRHKYDVLARHLLDSS